MQDKLNEQEICNLLEHNNESSTQKPLNDNYHILYNPQWYFWLKSKKEYELITIIYTKYTNL